MRNLRMFHRRPRVFPVCLAGLVIAAPLRAQEVAPAPAPASSAPSPRQPRFRLEYRAAPGCPDQETFHHAVVSYIERGVDPFDAAAPDVLRVAITKVTGGYRATVQMAPAGVDPLHAQEITDWTCSEVFRATARLASLRVLPPPQDPGPPEPTPEQTPPPAPAPSSNLPNPPSDRVPSPLPRVAPAPFAESRLTPPPRQAPTPTMDLAITLSTAFVMTAGLTADVGPALQIGAGLRRDWFSLDLELRGVFPATVWAREAFDPTRPAVPVPFDLSQLSAQLVPCVRFATYLAGCGVLGAYTFIKQDYGTVFAPGWIVGPRFGAEVPINERFAVFGFAEALFFPQPDEQRYILPPPGQTTNKSNSLWRSSPVAAFLGAGVLVKFQ